VHDKISSVTINSFMELLQIKFLCQHPTYPDFGISGNSELESDSTFGRLGHQAKQGNL